MVAPKRLFDQGRQKRTFQVRKSKATAYGGGNLLGCIQGGHMSLNELGRIVEDRWRAIPAHFTNAALDEMIVMPDHIHGIIIIRDDCRGDASAHFADASLLRWPNGTTHG